METPAEHASNQLAWAWESLRSVEVRLTYSIHNHKADPLRSPAFDKVVEHYIETASGERFYEFEGVDSKTGATNSKSLHYGDGAKFTDVNFDNKNTNNQNSVSVTHDFWMESGSDRKQLPQPLLYLDVGREPLSKAVLKARDLGQSEVLGRKCQVFLFPQVRWAIPQDQVFHLDIATSIPVKVESCNDLAARVNNRPMGVWTALSLDEVHGRFVPTKSRQVAFTNEGEEMFTWEYSVDAIVFDKDYPASTFKPILQPGVRVLDGTTNKSYEAPGVRKSQADTSKNEVLIPPLIASPPSNGASYTSYGLIGMGAMLILLGVVVWLRRSRKSTGEVSPF